MMQLSRCNILSLTTGETYRIDIFKGAAASAFFAVILVILFLVTALNPLGLQASQSFIRAAASKKNRWFVRQTDHQGKDVT